MFLCCFLQNFYKQLERKDTEEQTCHHTSDLPASSSHQQDWPPPSETPDMFDDDPWPEEEETGKEASMSDTSGKDVTFPATFEFLPMI